MKILEMFRGKTAERIDAEDRAATLAERLALVDERDRAAAARDAHCEPLARAVESANARVAEIEGQLRVARQAAVGAEQALASRAGQGDGMIARINVQLERGADPRIDALRDALEHEWALQRGNTSDGSPAMGRYMTGLREAQRECAALKVAAVADVETALAEIRGRIPARKFAAAA